MTLDSKQDFYRPPREYATDRVIVFPRPLPGYDWHPTGGKPVAVLAWCGRGPDHDEAFVVNEHGSPEWVDASGLQLGGDWLAAVLHEARGIPGVRITASTSTSGPAFDTASLDWRDSR